MKICIDAGHGGSQPGAVGYSGTLEKDITLAVALKLRQILLKQGFSVVMTRESDKDVRTTKQPNELQARCDVANKSGADYFVSIHCNASDSLSAHGTETWYTEKDVKSKVFANCIQSDLVKQIKRTDRGTKCGNYYVTKYTHMPAVLVELAFISNPEEEKLLKDEIFQWKCALGIANGILVMAGKQPLKEVNLLFKDVPTTHWAYKDIEKLQKLGVVKGDEKGNFNPDKTVTRAEVSAMLSRLYDVIKSGK